MNLVTLRNKYRSQFIEISDKYGIENVRVFGSVARGEESEASDIDFLVKLLPETSLLDLAGMWGDLKELLGTKVDIVSEATIPVYTSHIFEESVIL
ncbi:MAG: nucleotidyltransferase family protein [Pseudomonadota bacterium]